MPQANDYVSWYGTHRYTGIMELFSDRLEYFDEGQVAN